MGKLYTTSAMHDLQSAIKNNKAIITPYKDYSFLQNGYRSCGITMRFNKNDKDMVEKFVFMPDDMTNAIYKEWNKFPIYKFTYSDYRKDKKDFCENTPYSYVKYTVNDVEYLALIRKLIEITDDAMSEEDKVDFVKEYCDLIIDSRYYAIIKIVPYSDYNPWMQNDKTSMIAFNKEVNMDNAIDTDDDIDPYMPNNDTPENELPLF